MLQSACDRGRVRQEIMFVIEALNEKDGLFVRLRSSFVFHLIKKP